jgi:hypothetical protein
MRRAVAVDEIACGGEIADWRKIDGVNRGGAEIVRVSTGTK